MVVRPTLLPFLAEQGLAMTNEVPSPCVQRCQLDEAGAMCTGCQRTLAEISGWSSFDPAQKRAVWDRLLALPRTVQDKICQQCGAAFVCGSGGQQGQCWCADLPHVVPLGEEGRDCLCPACLRDRLLRCDKESGSGC